MTTTESPVVLITGASRGIGLAAAQAFSAAGYRLATVATDASALAEAGARLPSPPFVLAGDLSDFSFLETVVPKTIEQFGRIDVLVNNAAWRSLGSLRRTSLDDWERTLRICLTAPAFLSRWAAADMERRCRGVILNVGSIMSQQAVGISPAYVACKGALESLTYELAALYGPAGIRVVTIQPGAIDTDLSRDLRQDDQPDAIREFSEDMIMLQRWGRVEEIASVLLFLAGEGSSYITGTTIAVDGGWLRQHLPLSLKRELFEADFSSNRSTHGEE